MELIYNGFLDPVFYCNDLGNEPIRDPVGVGFAPRRSISIKEAVAFASSNNLMGIICSSKLLVGPFPFHFP